MGIFKKLTAYILAGFIAAACAMPNAAAQSPYSDHKEAVSALEAMGVYNAQRLKADNMITRAEFAEMLALLITRGENLPTGKTDQAPIDVGSEHWAFEAINTVLAAGIMFGYSDQSFLPEYPLTYGQLAASVVRLLGRNTQAINQGGYPAGYLSVATYLGLTKKLNMNTDSSVTAGAAAQMLYNALDVPVYVITGIKGDEIQLGAQDELTFAKHYLGLDKISGIVFANEATSLYSHDQGLAPGEILVNEVKLKSAADVFKYLGKSVIAYYDNETGIISYIAEQEGKNNIVTVQSKDVSGKSSTSVLYAEINQRTYSYQLASECSVILNGKAIDRAFDAAMLKPEDGFITLIDNNNDKTYDVLLIDDLRTMLVTSVDAESGKIYGKNSAQPLEISYDDTVRVLSGAEVSSISSIIPGSLINVGVSKNTNGNRHINIYLSNDKVRGTVEEISDDSVVISGQSYSISPYVLMQTQTKLSLGFTGSFLIDSMGRIAALGDDEGALKYGYLIVADVEGSIDKKLKLKILTASGEIVVFTASDNLMIDGERPRDFNRAMEVLETAARRVTKAYKGGVRQVIKYEGDNKKGEITYIDTVLENRGGLGGKREFHVCEDIIDRDAYYLNTSNSFEQVCMIGASSVLFYAPPTLPEEEYTAIYGSLGQVRSISFKITAYDVTDVNLAPVLVISSEYNFPLGITSVPAMVKKVYTGLNENGEESTFLDVLAGSAGSVQTWEVSKAVYAASLGEGDVIRFAYNQKQQIIEISVVFSPSDPYGTSTEVSLSSRINGTPRSSYRVVCGELYDHDPYNLLIGTVRESVDTFSDLTAGQIEPNYIKSAKYFIYDGAKKEGSRVDWSSTADFRTVKNWGSDASVVVTRCRSMGNANEVFIFNNIK